MKARFYVDYSGRFDHHDGAPDSFRRSVVWPTTESDAELIESFDAPAGYGPITAKEGDLQPLTPLLARLFHLTAAQRRLLRNHT